jgi:SAM-dependent methyltransferase
MRQSDSEERGGHPSRLGRTLSHCTSNDASPQTAELTARGAAERSSVLVYHAARRGDHATDVRNQTDGWNDYYRRGRLASMPELFVVRFFRGLRNRGGFLSEHLMDTWSWPGDPSVLDFGCGNGRHLAFLAHEGWNVTGCDISADAIALAQQSVDSGRAPRVDVIRDSLPYSSAAFDIVVAHGVFDHIPAVERPAWQHEVARVLRPGGILYASFISGSLHGRSIETGEEVLEDGEESGLTQTFYSPRSIIEEYGELFDVRSIAYDDRGLVHPHQSVIEHRLWAFLERKEDPLLRLHS